MIGSGEFDDGKPVRVEETSEINRIKKKRGGRFPLRSLHMAMAQGPSQARHKSNLPYLLLIQQ